ncbi:hypothetical protein U1Q18_031815 [Sarracenia purpurea var. burkii]
MDDWQQLFQFAQSVFVGLIFSFILAKLIPVVVSFREENRSIVRGESVGKEPKPSPTDSKLIGDDSGASSAAAERSRVSAEEEQSVFEIIVIS